MLCFADSFLFNRSVFAMYSPRFRGALSVDYAQYFYLTYLYIINGLLVYVQL
jgi:hypothetical protein